MAITETINIESNSESVRDSNNNLVELEGTLESVRNRGKKFGEDSVEWGKKLLDNKEAMKVLSDVTNGYSDKIKNAIEISKLFMTQQQAASMAQKAYTAVMALSTAGLKLFRLALTSTGLGVIVIALGMMINNFDKVKKFISNIVPGLKQMGEAIGGIVNWITDFVGATSDASRALDKMAEDADKSLQRSQHFLDAHGDKYDEFTRAKFQANIDYQNKVKEISENDKIAEEDKLRMIKDFADKRNRMISKADTDREAANQKRRADEAAAQKAADDKLREEARKNAEKAAEEAKRRADEAAAKEKERTDAISKILEDYRKKEEDAIERSNLEKINLEEKNALDELDRLKATEDEKAKIQSYYNKQRIIEADRLAKELKEIEEGKELAVKNLKLDQKQWEIDHETDPVIKLEKQREVLEEQAQMELDALQKNIDTAKADSKEKMEAEAAFNLAKQNQTQALKDNELEMAKLKKEQEDAQLKREEELAQKRMDFGFRASSYLAELTHKKAEGEDKRTDEEIERDRAKAQNQINIAGNTVKMLADMGGKGAEFAKGVAVSQAIQDTYKGANAAYSSMASIPAVGPALGVAAAGVAVASGLMNVKKILATKPVEKSAPGGSGGSAGAAPAAPSFNLVQGTGANQIAEAIGGQNTPIQAYVVSSNVTTAQSLDRNILEQSSL